jgi:hypothetical protein
MLITGTGSGSPKAGRDTNIYNKKTDYELDIN